MLLIGEFGTLRLDLGSGLLCIAEVTSYRLLVARDKLETTKQGDESRTYITGLKGFSGDMNFNIRLADDPALFTTAQLIPSILAMEGEAVVPAEFYLQRLSELPPCESTMNKFPGWFSCDVLLDEITIEITGGGPDLMRGACRFTGTGDLTWNLG